MVPRKDIAVVQPGRVLLHVCCACCATRSVQVLREAGHEVTGFFYNPNIHPEEEYKLRCDSYRRLAEILELPVVESAYDPALWYEAVKGLEAEPEGGSRCAVCFRVRLQKTARTASEQGLDYFATTLTLGPQKDALLINSIGSEEGRLHGVSYIPSNFKKHDGFRQSVELSRTYKLYRQHYCGCCWSKLPA